MTIKDLKDQGLIIFECISGSRAYGLELAHSDTDIRGVFIFPSDRYFGLNYIPQIANETNDIVYYELGRFIELLQKNNPSMLELLATPADKVLIKHPLIEKIKLSLFLSKKCKDSFGGFAFTQIRKAQGLNKKIVNPVEKKKKTILAFCYVFHEQGSILLDQWLTLNAIQQQHIGLAKVPHAKDVYGIYIDKENQFAYKGILKKQNATFVLLSSIPKSEKVQGYLYFNQDGYIKYCKDYRAYWEWVKNRNEARYQNNLKHSKNYDSKNMMHTFRLLDMAKEILSEGKVIVKRPNRSTLRSIRNGDWEYEDLIAKASMKMKEIELAYATSVLPEEPDFLAIENLLIELRKEFYKQY